MAGGRASGKEPPGVGGGVWLDIVRNCAGCKDKNPSADDEMMNSAWWTANVLPLALGLVSFCELVLIPGSFLDLVSFL